jgi:hypothetical protein
LPNPVQASKHWPRGVERGYAGEFTVRREREDQLLAALERIQELERKLKEAGIEYRVR